MDIIKSVMPQLPAFLFGILSGICISYITYLLDERKSKNERQRKLDVEILGRLSRILKNKDDRDFIGYLRMYGVTDKYEGDFHALIENFNFFLFTTRKYFY